MTRTTLTDRLRSVFGPPRSDETSVDEGLWEVAAMVYVGDVYAALVTDDASAKPKFDAGAGLWPFIR